jgi:hypothetical protein
MTFLEGAVGEKAFSLIAKRLPWQLYTDLGNSTARRGQPVFRDGSHRAALIESSLI